MFDAAIPVARIAAHFEFPAGASHHVDRGTNTQRSTSQHKKWAIEISSVEGHDRVIFAVDATPKMLKHLGFVCKGFIAEGHAVMIDNIFRCFRCKIERSPLPCFMDERANAHDLSSERI